MGLVYADIELSNPRNSELLPITVDSLVDTGALTLSIQQHIALQLQLQELEKLEVALADGKKMSCPYVGPIQIKFEKRRCFTGALVVGNQALLGAIPVEDMNVLVHPSQRKLPVSADSPNIPLAIVM